MKSRFLLSFNPEASNLPIVHNLIAKHGLLVNILRAEIDEVGGKMIIEVSGEKRGIDKGVRYLKQVGVGVRPFEEGVKRNDESCIHCGACISICPTNALSLDPETRKIVFEEEKCVACGVCIDACPPRAMEILL